MSRELGATPSGGVGVEGVESRDLARAAPQRARGEVLYVAGYWALPGNRKRPVEHYLESIPRTLEIIAGQPLHLFYEDPAIAARFAALCGPLGISLRAERLPLAELPAARHRDAFLAGCRAMGSGKLPAAPKEKGRRHLVRDLEGSGEETYKSLLSIWMSKVMLTARVAATAAGDARFVAWIDVSIARVKDKGTNSDFTRQALDPARLNHYGSEMRYLGRRLPLSAGVLAATPAVWAEIDREFQAQLLAPLGDPYAHDEETVLGLIHRRRPKLFHTLGAPFRQIPDGMVPRLVRAVKNRLAAAPGRHP